MVEAVCRGGKVEWDDECYGFERDEVGRKAFLGYGVSTRTVNIFAGPDAGLLVVR